MKLDMDLIRDILLKIEELDDGTPITIELEFEGKTEVEIDYHVMLLDEAGLVMAIDFSNMGSHYKFKPQRMTWYGHQFLEDIRDPEIWRKTKEGAKKAGSFSLETISQIAKNFITEAIKSLIT